ncbi:MAG: phosphodiester glycosidase family protein [Turicibacter sp.]
MHKNKTNKQLLWLYLSLSSIFLIMIGGFAYYYNYATTLIEDLNQTVDEYTKTQSNLIEANKSLQQEVDQLLASQDPNEVVASQQLNSLSQEYANLEVQFNDLSRLYQETLAIKDEYAAQRPLSVTEIENTYRTLATETEALKTKLSEEQNKLKQDYETMNSHFYIDNDLKIKVMEEKTDTQNYFVAEVIASKNKPLSAEFASGQYGGARESVSAIASRMNAVLAINASGFYPSTNKPMGSLARDGMFLQNDGNFTWEVLTSSWSGDLAFHRFDKMEDILAKNINDSFAFGPILVRDSVPEELKEEETRAPRTAIGQLGYNHYVIVVADGRQEHAQGLTLSELQTLFVNMGATNAYNLDGGGSSTLYFNGKLLNSPSEGKERLVTDIIYF